MSSAHSNVTLQEQGFPPGKLRATCCSDGKCCAKLRFPWHLKYL